MGSFFKWVSAHRSIVLYLLIVGIGCMIYFILQKLHYREGVSNLQVYYGAGEAAWKGEPLYGRSFDGGAGFFESAPVIAYCFGALTLLPFALVNSFYYFAILIIYIFMTPYLLYRLEKDYHIRAVRMGWVLILVSFFLVDHLERELHLGNLNVFLLLMAFGMFRALERNRGVRASLLYALMVLMKPSMLILLPYFVWRGKRKVSLIAVGFLIAGFLIPVLHSGFFAEWERLTAWAQVWLANPLVHQSANTIYGIYNRWILNPLNYESGIAILPAVWILTGYILYRWYRNLTLVQGQVAPYVFFAVMTAVVPNLIHTDTEHFMWSWHLLTLLFILLQKMKGEGRRIHWIIAVLALVFIPYVVNSPDIVGRDLMIVFDEKGVMGFANLVIVGIFMWSSVKQGFQERNTTPV